MTRRTHGSGSGQPPTADPRSVPWALLVGALLAASPAHALLGLPIVDGDTELLDLQVTDGATALLERDVDASDLGPVFHSTTDGYTFSSGTTTVSSTWYAEIALAVDEANEASATIQGTAHEFADWYYAMESGSRRFSDLNATGSYDPEAGDYASPLLFTPDSQGTITLRHYDEDGLPNGGTPSTFYWSYDATKNRYVFGTSKDLRAAIPVAPVSVTGATAYEQPFHGNGYVVTANRGAPNYEPTITIGNHLVLASLPGSQTWYLLMDTPEGVHSSTYTHTFRVTANAAT